jgi:hypothetical protein
VIRNEAGKEREKERKHSTQQTILTKIVPLAEKRH